MTNFLSAHTPEIFLFVASIALLLWGVWLSKEHQHLWVYRGTQGSLFIGVLLFYFQTSDRYVGIKTLLTGLTILCLWVLHTQRHKDAHHEYEVYLLSLWALLGGLISVGNENMMVVFIGLELQTLALCIWIALSRKDFCIEASLKYFLFSSVGAVFWLYGMSWWLTVSPDLNTHHLPFDSQEVLWGGMFILIALAFKLFLFPFHWILPDAYQGTSLSTLLFFSTVPKATALWILGMIFKEIGIPPLWMYALIGMALGSLLISGVLGLVQNNLRRWLAYSAMGHTGFLSLSLLTPLSPVPVFEFYLVTFVLTETMLIGILLWARSEKEEIRDFNALSWIPNLSLRSGFLFAALILSLAGIPPFPGFFAKFFVIRSLIEHGHIYVSICALLLSVISMGYYLQILKAMFLNSSHA